MDAVADCSLVLVAGAREAIATQPLTGLEFVDACDVVAAAIANVSALGRDETRRLHSRIHGSLLGRLCAAPKTPAINDAPRTLSGLRPSSYRTDRAQAKSAA